jgi:hypothetical protein
MSFSITVSPKIVLHNNTTTAAMNSFFRRLCLTALMISVANSLSGSSLVPRSLEQREADAVAICRGTIVEVVSFRDPATQAIRTRTLVLVDEALKGSFPRVIRLIHDGGTLADEATADGFSPQFRPGERRLLFLARRADGSLEAADGRVGAPLLTSPATGEDPLLIGTRATLAKVGKTAIADVTDQAAVWFGDVPAAPVTALDASGLLVDGGSVPSRFLAPDRDEAIEYLVDADALPAGLTLNQLQVRRLAKFWAGRTERRDQRRPYSRSVS